MNKEWSEKNSEMQRLLKKSATFPEALQCLKALRDSLFQQISSIFHNYPDEAFARRPFPNADGYHSKTLAYSVWHVFRIEDIVAHELIAGDAQVFYVGNWGEKLGTSLVTTGNELEGKDIETFSASLDHRVLLQYAQAVKESTEAVLDGLTYQDMKRYFTDADRVRLRASGCVSSDENADWLVDYWCGKDISGLIRMPFSRHWIMHIEAMCRIKNRLCKEARKGVDPIAYCGLSCNHCDFSEWCGGCRTRYNTCSHATCFEDHVCPNATCCMERGLDGCYECPELDACDKGFFACIHDGGAYAKEQALLIRDHGKKTALHRLNGESYDCKNCR